MFHYKGSKKIYLWIFLICFVVLIAFINPDSFFGKKRSFHHSDLREVWSVETPKRILATPIVINNILILGCYDGVLTALSADTGKLLWSKTFSDFIFSLTTDQNGIVYAGTGLHSSTTGYEIAIEASTGNIIWQKKFTGHLEEPPFIDETLHQLWLGTGAGGLWSLDTRNGEALWHKDIGHLDATPLLLGNVLYVPAQIDETQHQSKFYALDATTGETLWELPLDGQPWATPIWNEQNHLILSNTAEGQIGVHKETDRGLAQGIALNGDLIWQTILPDMALTPNLHFTKNNQIISVLKSGDIVSLSPDNGKIEWVSKVAKGFATEGVILTNYQEDLIAATSEDGIFLIIDALNGKTVFSKKMGKAYGGGLAVSDQHIFVTSDHTVTAFKEKE